MNQLIINSRETEKRVAVKKADIVTQIYLEQPAHRSLLGNIYVGIVEKVVPHMKAAFVNLGRNETGYLPIGQVPSYFLSPFQMREKKSIGHFIHQGEKILVQVVKDQTESKVHRLSGLIELGGQSLVYRPYGKNVSISRKIGEAKSLELREWGVAVKSDLEGFLIRTAAMNLPIEELEDELTKMREHMEDLQKSSQRVKAPALLHQINSFKMKVLELLETNKIHEIYCDEFNLYNELKSQLSDENISIQLKKTNENIFNQYHLEQELENSLHKVVQLRNGSNIVIEEAEALTVIDVNSGKTPGKQDQSATILETNLLAAIEVARQIQLRNLSGMILVDFINMTRDEHKEQVLATLRKHLLVDRNQSTIHGYTKLGIVEITRTRTTPTFKQLTTIPCSVCKGTGAVASPSTLAFQLERELWQYKGQDCSEIIIEGTKDVMAYFTGEHQSHLKQLEETLLFKITLQEIVAAIPHYYIKRIVS